MGRIEDFNFHDDINLRTFKDRIRRIVNFGKYSIPIIDILPTWAAEPGEFVLYQPSSGGTTWYVYYGSAWVSHYSSSV